MEKGTFLLCSDIQACLATHLDKVRAKKDTLGRFILATNQCDYGLLDNHSILKQYKEQSCVESGFKFIKKNAFELDSFFLKTPERISALMMIMTLCLMCASGDGGMTSSI